jgi:hypothetical protein
MSTTVTNQPSSEPTGQPSGQISDPASGARSVNRRRRGLVSVVLAAALGFGAGAAVVGLTSSGDTTSRPAHAAPAVTPNVDVQAMWNTLSTLPEPTEANVVAGLTPGVRARLQAVAAANAAAGEHR